MTVDEAAAIEAEADAYPDERGEILLEAAAAWRAAGQPERANKLLTELVEAGGDDGCYARVDLAEACFADGTPDEAFEHLAALAGDPALEHSHAGLAAELLAELGHAEESLRWYDRAVARLTPEELRALSGPQGWAHMSAVTVRGRREVRRGLGLPADATDVNVTRMFTRVETFATAGKPDTSALQPTGSGLELMPVTHPNDLFAGEEARFRFLIDGEPAANLPVTVIANGVRYEGKVNESILTTDADGQFAVTWTKPGMYWINASYPQRQAGAPAPTGTFDKPVRRAGYSGTVEVLPQ